MEAPRPRAADARQVIGLRPLADDVVEVLLARVDEADARPPLRRIAVARVVLLVLERRAARRVPVLVVDPVGAVKLLVEPYESRAIQAATVGQRG